MNNSWRQIQNSDHAPPPANVTHNSLIATTAADIAKCDYCVAVIRFVFVFVCFLAVVNVWVLIGWRILVMCWVRSVGRFFDLRQYNFNVLLFERLLYFIV